MSHEMTRSDGFFTVRMAAWHSLGVVLKDYPSRAEAQQIAHPWEPVEEPAYRKVYLEPPTGDPEHDINRPYELQELATSKVISRTDSNAELGTVGPDYTLVTNTELWDVAEALEQSGSDVMFETGGSLRGGAAVWILVRLQEPIVVKGDPRGETIPYFALQNSHDGSGACRGQATMTRIVCANTSRVADMDAKRRGTEFLFKHTSGVTERLEEARTALAGWRESISAWQEQSEHLISLTLDPIASSKFLDRFIPMPAENLITERVRDNIVRDRQKWLDAYNSVTGEGLKNTAYGLVQASIEFAEWGRKAYNAESRFKRSFLTRNELVARAVELANQAAHE